MESTKGGRNSTFNDSIVREVRRKPIVFDPSHPLHANSLKKQEAWNEIAANLDEQVETVKTRWRTLRDRYTKERRRISLNGGESSFSYYTDLNFLDQCINDGRSKMMSHGDNSHGFDMESNPWPHLNDYLLFKNREDEIYVFECKVCLPKMHEIRAHRTTNHNIKNHFKRKHPAKYDELSEVIKAASNRGKRRQNSVTVSSAVKLEAFEQASDAGDELDSKNDDNPRTEAEEVSHADDLEPSISRIGASADRHLSVQQQTRPNSGSESGAVSDPVIIDDNGPPKKRFRSAPLTISAECSSSSSAVDTLADALLGSAGAFMRSADALQRLVDSRPTSTAHRSSVAADAQRDADECFADFVCMSLKAIDNESRVHARIAIIHALAQFQT